MTSRERFLVERSRLLRDGVGNIGTILGGNAPPPGRAIDPLNNALLAIGFLFTEIDRLQKRIDQLEGDQK